MHLKRAGEGEDRDQNYFWMRRLYFPKYFFGLYKSNPRIQKRHSIL